jgi:hypothetical protein
MMNSIDNIYSDLQETRTKIRRITELLEKRRCKSTEPVREVVVSPWQQIPISDYDRLQRNLQRTMKEKLKKDRVLNSINQPSASNPCGLKSLKKDERIKLTQTVLAEQNGLCALGTQAGGKYCRNAPRYASSEFLRLQWIHAADKHILVCACCSNYLKRASSLSDLYSELRSKQEHVLKLL